MVGVDYLTNSTQPGGKETQPMTMSVYDQCSAQIDGLEKSTRLVKSTQQTCKTYIFVYLYV